MENLMNDIFQRQNSDLFIERLRAQGHIYDKAKTYSHWIVVASIIVVFIISVLKLRLPDFDFLQTFSVVYGIVSTIACAVLEWQRKKKINLAARIQQLIDCDLFGISWWRNWGEKPALEEIQAEAKEESPDRYVNWYDEAIQKLSKQSAIIVCFRCNIMYDHKLRKKYIKMCHLIFWSIFSLIFVWCVWMNYSFLDIIYCGVAPALPVIMMYVRTWIAENTDTANLERIRSYVENLQQRILNGEVIPANENLLIQDAIFAHRNNSFSIPTFFYKKYRSENEESMHEFASRLAEHLIKA